MGDMQHPDGVTGASHRYSAAPPTIGIPHTCAIPGQEPEPPVKPKISPPHAEQPSKPANILVSHPTMTRNHRSPLALTALPQSKGRKPAKFQQAWRRSPEVCRGRGICYNKFGSWSFTKSKHHGDWGAI